VALKGQQGVVAVHAVAVVGDADELAAARFDFDADARGARVQGILQQLFDHRSRPVDHLAGGDLVGHLVGKNADAPHSSSEYRSGQKQCHSNFLYGETSALAALAWMALWEVSRQVLKARQLFHTSVAYPPAAYQWKSGAGATESCSSIGSESWSSPGHTQFRPLFLAT
jgi:hypothetical protein